jgi:beta-lactamase superfamily II metal-dependent hydrolase
MKQKKAFSAFCLIASFVLLVGLFSSLSIGKLLIAETNTKSCADIVFGTAETSTSPTPTTSSFKTHGLTVASISQTSCYCAASQSGLVTDNSMRIGKSGGAGSITFTFSSLRITSIKVLAYKYSTDSSKTATCTVTTSALTTAQNGQTVTATSAPDITDQSTDAGLVFTGLDNGGQNSTTLTIAGTSTARFNLCKIVLTINGTSSSSASSSGGVSSTVASSSTSETTSYPSGSGESLKVYALEQTGQYGDCTLFKLGNTEVLFDGGNTGSSAQLADMLNTYVTDHVLDLLVLTHPHTDHYGGFTNGTTANSSGGALVDGGITSITKLIDNGADGYGSGYQTNWVNGIRSFFVGKGTTYYAIKNIVSGHMNDAIWSLADNFRIQWLDTSNYPTVGGAGPSDANDGSVSCDVRFGTYDFVMCGDLPSTPEETLATNYASNSFIGSGNTVVFKACHHCSKTANSATFLAFISPTYAFSESGIESGNQSNTGPVVDSQHPYLEPRQRIETYTGVEHFWWVGTCGTLTMMIPSDYSSFTIHGAGRKYGTYYYQGSVVDPNLEKDYPLDSKITPTKWATLGC